MSFTGICTARNTGFRIANEDIDTNANIDPNKLGFRIKYVSFNAPEMSFNGVVVQDGVFPSLEFDNTTTRYFRFAFALPGDYASDTDAAFDIFWKSSLTIGSIRFFVELSSVGEGAASTAAEFSQAVIDPAAPVANQINKASIALPASLFAPNDIVGVVVTRDPADASDTLEASAYILLARFAYNARG